MEDGSFLETLVEALEPLLMLTPGSCKLKMETIFQLFCLLTALQVLAIK